MQVDRTRLTVKRKHDAIYSVGGSDFFFLRLWLSGYAEDKDLVQHIKAMNGARKAAIAANNKFLSTPVRLHHSPFDGH